MEEVIPGQKWRQLKEEFHKEMENKKCAGCKKEEAVSMIRGKPVCNKCFRLVKSDNLCLFRSGEKIPKNLHIHKYKLDRIIKKQYKDFFKNWNHKSGMIYDGLNTSVRKENGKTR